MICWHPPRSLDLTPLPAHQRPAACPRPVPSLALMLHFSFSVLSAPGSQIDACTETHLPHSGLISLRCYCNWLSLLVLPCCCRWWSGALDHCPDRRCRHRATAQPRHRCRRAEDTAAAVPTGDCASLIRLPTAATACDHHCNHRTTAPGLCLPSTTTTSTVAVAAATTTTGVLK